MATKVVHLFKCTQSAGGTTQSKTSDLLEPDVTEKQSNLVGRVGLEPTTTEL
jgi:hypothetical protein